MFEAPTSDNRWFHKFVGADMPNFSCAVELGVVGVALPPFDCPEDPPELVPPEDELLDDAGFFPVDEVDFLPSDVVPFLPPEVAESSAICVLCSVLSGILPPPIAGTNDLLMNWKLCSRYAPTLPNDKTDTRTAIFTALFVRL